MQALPIGIQHVAALRKRGDLSIDKTRQIHGQMNLGAFHFLIEDRLTGDLIR